LVSRSFAVIEHGGETKRIAVADLMVVKPFGEPVYPVLKLTGQVSRTTDKPYHVVLNGENFHALQLAAFAYEGRADCIYIDPPYNTGARDWTYNNDYVDDNDSYRHSKWLSFMERRLVLARKLMKKDSVLVVTIDEHEVSRLGVLLSQMFKDADITLVTIVMNTKGVTRAGVPRFSRVEEYAYFCFFGNAGVSSIGDDLLTESKKDSDEEIAAELEAAIGEAAEDPGDDGPSEASEQQDEDDEEGNQAAGPGWRKLLRSGDDPRRQDRELMFYPIWIEPETKKIVRIGDFLPLGKAPSYKPDKGGYMPIWPIRQNGTEGRWGVGAPTLRKLVEQGFVRVGRFVEARNTWGVSYLTRQIVADIASGKYEVQSRDEITGVATVVTVGAAARRIKTVWFRKRHNAGVGGTALVSKLVGSDRPFSFPKSVYAVRDTLSMLLRDKKDALVLDYFAGSGTTLHATAMLNEEDGGRRQCVLITNNQVEEKRAQSLNAKGLFMGDKDFDDEGICRSVTVPRVTAALTGIGAKGKSLPGKYIDGTPLSEGYDENAAFFDIQYRDPDDIDAGVHFNDILPALWMAAGGHSSPAALKSSKDWFIAEDYRLAVLLDEDRLKPFLKQVSQHKQVTNVWLVTDSESAFARIKATVPAGLKVGMLYRDYLRNFRINVEDAR
jgi:adenine-specific DNA-methyltransferase